MRKSKLPVVALIWMDNLKFWWVGAMDDTETYDWYDLHLQEFRSNIPSQTR